MRSSIESSIMSGEMTMERPKSGKGHPNYYLGKKVDRKLFYELLVKFCNGEVTLTKAAKMLGLSNPTLSKRYNAVLLKEEVPEAWFLDGNIE